MSRYHVQMSFQTPALTEEFAHAGKLGGRGQQINMLGGNGELAVTATVNADSAPDAAMAVTLRVQQLWHQRGSGPLRLQSWTARRVPFAGLASRPGQFGPELFGDGGWQPPGGDDEGGGLAGVREPRRPLPGPPSLRVELEQPAS